MKVDIATTMDLRQKNRRELLSLMLAKGRATRNELRETTGFSYTTIGNLLSDLDKDDLIVQGGEADSTGGRKARIVELKSRAHCFLALDLTGPVFSWGVFELDGKAYCRDAYPVDPSLSRPAAVERFLDAARDRARELGVLSALRYAGAVIPGFYDEARGVVENSPENEMDGLELGRMVKERFGLPCIVRNDARTAAYGELASMPDPESRQLFYLLVLKESMGAAIALDGRIYEGADKYTGEIFMMPIHSGGEEKRLGDLLSPAADLAAASAAVGAPVGDEEFFRLFEQGRSFADELYRKTVGALARAVLNVACVLNPTDVVVGGFYSGYGPRLASDVRAELGRLGESWQEERLFLRMAPPTPFSLLKGISRDVIGRWVDTLWI